MVAERHVSDLRLRQREAIRPVNRRSWLKLLSAAVAGLIAAPVRAATGRLTNWAGNITYGTDRVSEAASVARVQQVLRSLDHVKVQGTRHCFNTIADSRDNLLSLKPMHEAVALDPAART